MLRILHPELYQGPENLLHKKGYFEGWYFKLVSPDNRSIAVIPGVSLNPEDSYAFIQTINGNDGSSTFNKFSIDDFQFNKQSFAISIADNHFSMNEIKLGDHLPISGHIGFSNMVCYKASLRRPGIMGWYRWLPFMECYHGLISLGHDLSGSLKIDNSDVDYTEGRGYIEKDWGTSFPSSYIWMQSNSFHNKEDSFMLSVARIPWFGSEFRGFLGFLKMGSKTIIFATYTSAVLTLFSEDDDSVLIKIQSRGRGGNQSLKRGEMIQIHTKRKHSGDLIAPTRGGVMDRRISESIDSKIHVQFFDQGQLIYEDHSKNSGLEIVGEIQSLES